MYDQGNESDVINDDDDPQTNEEFLEQAKKNIYSWYDYFAVNYQTGNNDKQFALMIQWNSNEQEEIIRLGLPSLQFNKLYDFCKKIIGEARDITPTLQVRSKKYVSDTDDASNLDLQQRINLMQNFLRALAYNSESQIAYETAFENAIYCGYGAIHIKYEYEDSTSFDRKIRVAAVPISEKAFFDPSATNPTKSDGEFCGVYYNVDKSLFKKLYPDIPFPVGFPENTPNYFGWEEDDTITIVDYYYKDWFKKSLILLDNGQVIEDSELDDYLELCAENNLPIPTISDRREADDNKIMHCKMIKDHILERNDHPSKVLPVIYEDGDSYIYQGNQYTQSFIHHAIDAQRFLNYTGIAIAQGLKNARKEQYMATPAMIKGYDYQWQRPELYQGALMYNFDPKAGKPDKLPPSEIPQSLYQNYERANDDIQSILGIYNANLGAPTSEISGVAINAKVQQGNFGASVYRNNLIRSIEQVGRAILSMIPTVYDTERSVSLLAQDGKSTVARINQRTANGDIKNNVTEEIFDLAIEAGASYEAQKQTALDLLLKLLSIAPQAFPLVADLVADNLDIINRPQMVERLRTLVPAAIIAKEKGEAPPPPPPPASPPPDPAAQAKMMQAQVQQQKNQSESQIQNRKLDIEEQKLASELHRNDIAQQQQTTNAQDSQSMAHVRNLQAIAEMYRTSVESKNSTRDSMANLLATTHRITSSPVGD
jgi:hypothetical protein